VEPSLQAAFVEYGGNRHGFLAFSEFHPDYFQIPVSDREELAAEQARLVEEANREAEDDVAEDDVADDDDNGDSVSADDDDDQGDDDETSTQQSDDDDDEASNDNGDDDQSVEVIDVVIENDAAAPNEASDDEAGDIKASGDVEADAEAADGEEAGDDGEAAAQEDAGESDEQDGDDVAAEDDDGETAKADSPASTEAAERPRSRSRGRRRSRKPSNEDEGERAEAAMHAAILKRGYRIQEVIKRRQIVLIQVVKEERGNKGAALTTYLSIAGRYCVLMPNTPRGGGISRKIADVKQRRRLKEVAAGLEVPEGMGLIIRTAGQGRTKLEIKRDFNSLLKQWEEIRSATLQATAPSLIYEEANIIKRAIRDLYAKDIDEILVEGDEGYKMAKTYMKLLMPSHAARVKPYKEATSLFHRYEVESQLEDMHSPVVQLKSGGYIVINQTEALVAIDVNSGRSTKERNIEETAVKTNVEAAAEIGRQLRLRDLAGLIVIDFIDMDENRNERTVERKVKEAVKPDRARIQIGRISGFGLMEMSRQRLRPSFQEALSDACPHCGGSGYQRSTESTVLHVLRGIEDAAIKGRAASIRVLVPTSVALYLLNEKRLALIDIEERHALTVVVAADDTLIAPDFRVEVVTPSARPIQEDAVEEKTSERPANETRQADDEEDGGKKRKRRRRRRKDRNDDGDTEARTADSTNDDDGESRDGEPSTQSGDDREDGERKRRRRGKRGGRRRRGRGDSDDNNAENTENGEAQVAEGEGGNEEAATSEEAQDKPKPHRRRSRAKKSDETAAADDASEASVEAEPSAEEPAVEPVAERDPEPEQESEKQPEPVASEGVTTTRVAVGADQVEVTTDAGSAEEDAPVEEPAPAAPARRGWWQKIVNPD
ncbi:MAG: Rne/Rng family ribonuclease, partial [Rhodospirillaceae bacterium]|nr:Rne/Rng family ribonuclease [Rhodospirillaceae bacterium]